MLNVFMFFLLMHVFIFRKHAKLNRFVSATWHSFLHSLRYSRAVSYIELLFCVGDRLCGVYCYEADTEAIHEQY